ncbi:hypothetical protein Tco_0566891 [Tanacetum coccineum]
MSRSSTLIANNTLLIPKWDSLRVWYSSCRSAISHLVSNSLTVITLHCTWPYIVVFALIAEWVGSSIPSAFKIKELEQDKPADPKALLSVDSMVNWSDHEESADENASQVYGMIAGRDDEVAGEFALMGVTSQVQTCPFGCHDKYAELKKEFDDLEVQYKEYYIQVQAYKNTLKTLEQQKAWYQSNQLAYEEKVKVLKRDLENTTNLLKYSESINNNVNLEKQELQTKLDNTLARFAKWKESSKNLAKDNGTSGGGADLEIQTGFELQGAKMVEKRASASGLFGFALWLGLSLELSKDCFYNGYEIERIDLRKLWFVLERVEQLGDVNRTEAFICDL